MDANGNGTPAKLKVAMYWAASCGGCDISLLEIGPNILDLIQLADVAFWPCAADFKYKDVAAYPDGYLDVCLFNGAVRNNEQEQIARLLRKKSKCLVAYGACAGDGGIPALANLKSIAGILDASYHNNPSTANPEHTEPQPRFESEVGELEIPELYPSVLRLKDMVHVDYEIPGCPPQADRVWEVLQLIAGGEVPLANDTLKVGCTDKSVCDECPLEKRLTPITQFHRPHQIVPEPGWCLLEQGLMCSGRATRSGCGALCIKGGLPCRGCYGPPRDVSDQGMALIGALGGLVHAADEREASRLVGEIVDPVGTFYRFTIASSMLKCAKPAKEQR